VATAKEIAAVIIMGVIGFAIALVPTIYFPSFGTVIISCMLITIFFPLSALLPWLRSRYEGWNTSNKIDFKSMLSVNATMIVSAVTSRCSSLEDLNIQAQSARVEVVEVSEVLSERISSLA
jgi:hypothetical protein